MNKRISSLDDLKEYGIKYLTSEACGLSLRMLFDLNEKGKQIIIDFFGMHQQSVFASNWNSGSIASILLPRSIILDLAAFCLLQDYEVVVIHKNEGYAYGMAKEDYQKITAKYYEKYKDARFLFKEGTAKDGFRNKHVFSGRTL